jgi:hypothetical protein
MSNFFFNLQNLKIGTSLKDIAFDDNELSDEAIKISYLGTPVISNVSFKPGSYEVNGQIVQFEGIDLDTVLITISQSKNIVTTAVAGGSGTFKEYISQGDYIINIKGLLVSEDDDTFPEEQVRILNEILKAPISLDFTSEFIDKFDSFNLTITDYSFAQQEGFRNQQAFEINALSDNPIELQLNEEANL